MSYGRDGSWRTQRPGGIAAIDLGSTPTLSLHEMFARLGEKYGSTTTSTKGTTLPTFSLPTTTVPTTTTRPRLPIRSDVAITRDTAPSISTAVLPTAIPSASDKPGRTTTGVAVATPGGAPPAPGSVSSGTRVLAPAPPRSVPAITMPDVGPVSIPDAERAGGFPFKWVLIGGAALAVVYFITTRK